MKAPAERSADHGHPPRDRRGRTRGRRAVPGSGATAGLDEGEQQGEHRGPEQQDPDRVEVEARRGGPVGRRQPASGEHDGDDGDGKVDEEDPAPPRIGPERADDETSDDGPDGGRDADGRPQHAEGASALASGEHLLDEARHLRVEDATGRSLHEPREDEHGAARGEPADEARRAEEHDADDEDRAPADGVTHTSGSDEGQTEREGIARHDPLQVARRRIGPLLDRGQRDVDDADVEQRHETCDEAHREGAPPSRVRRLGSLSGRRLLGGVMTRPRRRRPCRPVRRPHPGCRAWRRHDGRRRSGRAPDRRARPSRGRRPRHARRGSCSSAA